MSDVIPNDLAGHVKLPRIRHEGEREVWVTVLHHYEMGVHLVIGAGTRGACIDAFRRMSKGAWVDTKLVYYTAFRKLDITGYGFAFFRAEALSALEVSK
jgi:hypothetical protein